MALRTRLLNLLRSDRVTSEIEREMQFHLAERIDELIAGGMSPEAARREAHRRFGNETRMVERTRAIDLVGWLETLLSDARYALRGQRAQPGFALVVLFTLALGIGANSAIFSVVDAALLRPLPFASPDQLVHVWETQLGDVHSRSEASYPDFIDFRARTRTFSALEGFNGTNVIWSGSGETRMLRGLRVTAGFLSLLGVQPRLGRNFAAGEDGPEGSPVVIVSDELWRRELGSDPDILGRKLILNASPFTVIGVLPRGFRFAAGGDAEFWVPLDGTITRRAERSNHWVNVVGRVAAGFSFAQAQADLSRVMRGLAAEYPESNSGRDIALVPVREEAVGDMRPIILLLVGAVGVVLLIACANVAGLLLARGLARRHEMAVRSALGAGRSRLLRQLLTETAVLAGIGALLGTWLARSGLRSFLNGLPDTTYDQMPYLHDVVLDSRALGFTIALTLGSALLMGIFPALSAAGVSANTLLRSSGRTTTRLRLREALVSAEIALTVVLLLGAGLLARSLAELLRVDAGFRTENVVTGRVALYGARYQSDGAQQRFIENVIARLRAVPGVATIGGISDLPLGGGGTNTFRVERGPEPDASRRPEAFSRMVAGDYFRALRIPLIAGRVFTARDDSAGQPSIMINESLARKLFDQRPAVGERVRFYSFPDTPFEIIGVVGDVKTQRLDGPAPPTIYFTHLQRAENRMTLVIHSNLEPSTVAHTIRREVHSLDPEATVYGVRPFEEQVAQTPALYARRYPLFALGAFGVVAFLLAVIGIYGVIAFTVRQRSKEFGIRLALGARIGQVKLLVLRQGARIALPGILLGLIAGAALARLIETLLYGVAAFDPLVYSAVAATTALTVLAACYIPAHRTRNVDPALTLRGE